MKILITEKQLDRLSRTVLKEQRNSGKQITKTITTKPDTGSPS